MSQPPPDDGGGAGASSDAGAAGGAEMRDPREAFSRLLVSNDGAADPAHRHIQKRLNALQKRHVFWETQPVVQFDESTSEEEGPIDAPLTVEQVRQEPYPLPASYEWSTCNMDDDAVCEEVYQLLTNNYVEDDDAMFRFDYSRAFLKWALQPPGFRPEWLVGVRVAGGGKLVAFITGVPATIRVVARSMRMAEINFLCVHKKLRSKRLAPLLIKEVTRRVNLCDIWQASYTAGVVLPKPVAICRYWHRSLNPKKLIEVGFSRLGSNMTMARTIKLYKLPDKPATAGLRSMEPRDVPRVAALLNAYLGRFHLVPHLSEEEVRHWLLPRDDVVYAYVVEPPGGGPVTDFFSFYSLPSTVINHPVHKTLRAAYCYYYAPGSLPHAALMREMLTVAAAAGFDVFNALDLMQNAPELLKELKFGIGDGHLQFYLYNWRTPRDLKPDEVGLVLL